jgi:hypothetical protein
VFLLVEPTVELLSLHRAATETFDVTGGMYVPHLSLVYSDVSVEERVAAVASIDIATLPDTARIDRIALVETTGAVPEWESVGTYDL